MNGSAEPIVVFAEADVFFPNLVGSMLTSHRATAHVSAIRRSSIITTSATVAVMVEMGSRNADVIGIEYVVNFLAMGHAPEGDYQSEG